jgi:hypothetical protein
MSTVRARPSLALLGFLAFVSGALPLLGPGGSATAQAAEPPRIDLYTMGPGEETFTRFGHAAICVTDDRTPQGRCYNYGTADFSTPVPLTWNFVRGRAMFRVSVQDLQRMVAAYVRQDRSIWRQRLPLPPARAQEIADALEASTAQAVRFYRYHHFNDNCTTRVRDLLDRALGGALSNDRARHEGDSFRAYARAGFGGDVPLLLAAELLLGRPADERTSPWQAMFLPEVFRREVAARLGAQPELVYARQGPPPSGSMLLGRGALAGAGVLLAVLTLLGARLGRRARAATLATAGFTLGLAGLVLWALAVLSTFPELRWNEALLCLWPTDLWLPWAGRRYLLVRLGALGLVALLSLVGALVQPLGAVLVLCAAPLAATLATRREAPRQ